MKIVWNALFRLQTLYKGVRMNAWEKEMYPHAHTNPREKRLMEHDHMARGFLLLWVCLAFGLCAYQQQNSPYPQLSGVGVVIAIACSLWAVRLFRSAYVLSKHRATILREHQVSDIRLVHSPDASWKINQLMTEITLKSLQYDAICNDLQGKADPKSDVDRALAKQAMQDAYRQHHDYVQALKAFRYLVAGPVKTSKGRKF
ncbi:MAG: hypothetical protein JWO40_601 [Candidatus Doudnabacteria bacterium]|nr:hypothetical protein [Candidatus Doudnabacteria bacterium]